MAHGAHVVSMAVMPRLWLWQEERLAWAGRTAGIGRSDHWHGQEEPPASVRGTAGLGWRNRWHGQVELPASGGAITSTGQRNSRHGQEELPSLAAVAHGWQGQGTWGQQARGDKEVG